MHRDACNEHENLGGAAVSENPMSRSSAGLALALPLLGASVGGCTVTTAPVPTTVVVGTQPAATLVVEWTIQGRRDPAGCTLSGARSIQVHIVAISGADAGTYEQVCSAFATTITLVPGTYAGTAWFLDGAGQPRTTTVTLSPFSILGDDELHTPIDFPATSFF